MRCSVCGHDNQAGARFCSQCGNSLSLACGVCSTAVGPDDKFCNNCGNPLGVSAQSETSDIERYLPKGLLDKLQAAREGRSMAGERRTVTMLFADIQGSTAAAEQLDPEDWADVVNGAFEHLITPVHRYEGTLARLQGDAVLAFFGAPIAHEDDPIRAVRAGLDLVEAFGDYRDEVERRWGFPIEVRVGINTGLVVVGEVGSDLRVEYTALGDAINTAARMEQTADPGTVRIAERTRSLVGAAFDIESIGPVQVKGKSEPVPSYRVLQVAGGFSSRRRSPIVGRETELARFDELRESLADGTGWIASIIGEAGLGKSALLAAIERRADEAMPLRRTYDAEGFTWMFCASRSYDSAIPFSSIADLLRRWWRIAEAHEPFGRITDAVAAVGQTDPDAPALLAHIADVPMPPDVQGVIDALPTPTLHARATEALRDHLRGVFSSGPGFLVFEDLHWADSMSLAVVDEAMDLAEDRALGIVVAMRPYRTEPTWRIHEVATRDHHHRYHSFEVGPLPEQAGEALLERLLPPGEMGEMTRTRLLERAEGNPLFLEEMARSVRDEGEDVAVPASLEGLLVARLDRLGDEARHVVQLASVVGAEFERSTLAAVVGQGNIDRVITDLLRRGVFAEAGPSRLVFRHALLQETAKETILRKTRRELHVRVADHLLSVSPDAAESISMHLVEANEHERAFPHLIASASRAIRTMALSDAVTSLELAIAHTPIDAEPADVVQAHNLLGEAYGLIPDLTHAAATYQRLIEYSEENSRPEARVAALNRLAFATASLGFDLEAATAYSEQARSLAAEVGDETGLAEYHMNACFISSMKGELVDALQHDKETVVLGESTGIGLVRLSGLLRRAVNSVMLFEFDGAEESIQQALDAAHEAGAEEGVAIIDGFGAGVLQWARGDIHGALARLVGDQPVYDRYNSFYRAMGQFLQGSYLLDLGDPENALVLFAEARRVAEQNGQSSSRGCAEAGMAHSYAVLGMPEQIAELEAHARSSVTEGLGSFMSSGVWSRLAWAHLDSGDAAGAEELATTGLAAGSVTQYLERLRILLGRAFARIDLGDVVGARHDVDTAVDFAQAHDVHPFDAMIARARGELAFAEENHEEASAALTEALALGLESGQRLEVLRTHVAAARVAVARGADPAASIGAVREAVDSIATEMTDDALVASMTAYWNGRIDPVIGVR